MKPKLLCDTAGMTEERWLECRMHGPDGKIPYTIGGSDVAAIFGVSPWTTPLDLYMMKKGKKPAPPKDNKDQLMLGHWLEPIVADMYAHKTGNTVINDTNMYQHADHPYALADFDRRIIRKSDGEEGILECKTTSYRKSDAWADERYPLYYDFQLRYYLSVADVNFGSFACLWGTNPETDFAMPSLERDMAKENDIFEMCDRFIWGLEHDVPPDMNDVAPKLALQSLARIYGADKTLGDLMLPTKLEKNVQRLYELQENIDSEKEKIKKLEEEAEAHCVRIANVMQAYEHAVLETTSNKYLIDYVTRITRRADSGLLKTKYPSVYDDVLKTSESRKVKIIEKTAV